MLIHFLCKPESWGGILEQRCREGRRDGYLAVRRDRVSACAGSLAEFIWLFLSSSDLWDDELQRVLLYPHHVPALPGHPSVQNREN